MKHSLRYRIGKKWYYFKTIFKESSFFGFLFMAMIFLFVFFGNVWVFVDKLSKM